jgi:uncharacterized protein
MATLKKNLTALGIAGAMSAMMAAATPAAAQSFDCSGASLSSEKAICSNDRLGALDERMERLYASLMQSFDHDDQREGLRAYQIRFLAARDRCGRNVSCIKGAYLDQIEVLSARLRYAENRWDR